MDVLSPFVPVLCHSDGRNPACSSAIYVSDILGLQKLCYMFRIIGIFVLYVSVCFHEVYKQAVD